MTKTDSDLRHQTAYAGERVLVTGGAGAIGANLVRQLLDLGAEVMVVDDLRSGHLWNLPQSELLRFVHGDVLDDAVLSYAFRWRPRVVFHLAAFFANQNSVDYPERDLEVNGLGTLRVLEKCLAIGVDRLVYASSSSIYGSNPDLPVEEDYVSLELTTPYQATKLLGELYCSFYTKHHGLPTVRIRFFNSYGPGEVPGQYRNVVPNFIYWAMSERPLPITGDPDATRDFTFVVDIVDGLLAAGHEPDAVGEAINLAAGRETKIGELAQMVRRQVGSEVEVVELGRRTWDTKPRLLGSNKKAKRLLGFEPSTELEDGLGQTVAWFRENWDDIESEASFAPGRSASLPRAAK